MSVTSASIDDAIAIALRNFPAAKAETITSYMPVWKAFSEILPGCKPPTPQTIQRWRTEGQNGVKLFAIKLNGEWMTSPLFAAEHLTNSAAATSVSV